jgi:hypothetical protein
MGLLASCLLFVLSPQDPVATAPVAVTPPPAVEAPAPDDAAALAAAELAGAKADPDELARLACVADAKVANRAAWLLARRKDRPAWEPTRLVATTSPHADARVFALQGLLAIGDVGSTAAGVTGLEDADRRVRTLAAQVLGKLRRPTAVEPLLALLERARTNAEPGQATDVQATLLALTDLGAADALLRALVSLDGCKAEGTGPALVFCCQSLLPKLSEDRRRTFLLSALEHRELLLRRYAIGALAETEDASVAKALEGRLAKEGAELRPLVEMALARVRIDAPGRSESEMARATKNFEALVATAKARWQTMDDVQRGITAGSPVLLLVLALWWRARRRRARALAATVAVRELVQPSEEYLAEEAAAAEADAEADAVYGDDSAPTEDADAEQYDHAGPSR